MPVYSHSKLARTRIARGSINCSTSTASNCPRRARGSKPSWAAGCTKPRETAQGADPVEDQQPGGFARFLSGRVEQELARKRAHRQERIHEGELLQRRTGSNNLLLSSPPPVQPVEDAGNGDAPGLQNEDYVIRGFIDRLGYCGNGVYEIHDYKTSGFLPSQDKLDADRQLALYQIGIKEQFPMPKT